MKSAVLGILLAAAWAQADLNGVWMVSGSPNLSAEPAYTPAYKKIWDERKKNLKQNDPATFCLPNGAVRVGDFPYKIVQTPKLVVILSEGNTHSYRRLFLDGRKFNFDVEDESWTGQSIGHWEGDTLVVETKGFNDRTWLDGTGKPHSDALHMVERFRRAGPAKLEVQYTLEDAKAFTKPFTFTRTFALQAKREIQEQFCTDQNHLAGK